MKQQTIKTRKYRNDALSLITPVAAFSLIAACGGGGDSSGDSAPKKITTDFTPGYVPDTVSLASVDFDNYDKAITGIVGSRVYKSTPESEKGLYRITKEDVEDIFAGKNFAPDLEIMTTHALTAATSLQGKFYFNTSAGYLMEGSDIWNRIIAENRPVDISTDTSADFDRDSEFPRILDYFLGAEFSTRPQIIREEKKGTPAIDDIQMYGEYLDKWIQHKEFQAIVEKYQTKENYTASFAALKPEGLADRSDLGAYFDVIKASSDEVLSYQGGEAAFFAALKAAGNTVADGGEFFLAYFGGLYLPESPHIFPFAERKLNEEPDYAHYDIDWSHYVSTGEFSFSSEDYEYFKSQNLVFITSTDSSMKLVDIIGNNGKLDGIPELVTPSRNEAGNYDGINIWYPYTEKNGASFHGEPDAKILLPEGENLAPPIYQSFLSNFDIIDNEYLALLGNKLHFIKLSDLDGLGGTLTLDSASGLSASTEFVDLA